jgi:hypothetical protein
MRNKNVGFLIIGIALIMGFLVLLFNLALREIVTQSCGHGSSCPMYGTIVLQTYIGLILVAFVVIIGLFLIFSKPEEKIIIKKVKERKKRLNLEGLNEDEKNVIKLLRKEHGGMFQRTLMEELELGKVKVTRLLDKLESKQLIERKRRGMNNIVILKQ